MFCTQCKCDKFNTVQSERNKNLRGNAAFSLDSRTNLRYQQCVEEQVAKGRSDNAFWKSMSGVGDSGGTALPASTAPQLIVVSDQSKAAVGPPPPMAPPRPSTGVGTYSTPSTSGRFHGTRANGVDRSKGELQRQKRPRKETGPPPESGPAPAMDPPLSMGPTHPCSGIGSSSAPSASGRDERQGEGEVQRRAAEEETSARGKGPSPGNNSPPPSPDILGSPAPPASG